MDLTRLSLSIKVFEFEFSLSLSLSLSLRTHARLCEAFLRGGKLLAFRTGIFFFSFSLIHNDDPRVFPLSCLG